MGFWNKFKAFALGTTLTATAVNAAEADAQPTPHQDTLGPKGKTEVVDNTANIRYLDSNGGPISSRYGHLQSSEYHTWKESSDGSTFVGKRRDGTTEYRHVEKDENGQILSAARLVYNGDSLIEANILGKVDGKYYSVGVSAEGQNSTNYLSGKIIADGHRFDIDLYLSRYTFQILNKDGDEWNLTEKGLGDVKSLVSNAIKGTTKLGIALQRDNNTPTKFTDGNGNTANFIKAEQAIQIAKTFKSNGSRS